MGVAGPISISLMFTNLTNINTQGWWMATGL